jgi:ketosteroid isomerase-like protein
MDIGARTGPFEVLDRFYNAEIQYVAAGGASAGADFSDMASYLHPDAVLRQGPSVPFPGDWSGIDGVERFFAAFSSTWSSLDLSEITYFEAPEGVAISMRMRATARATERKLDARVGQFILFTDGLIHDFTVFYLDPVAVSDVTRP